MKHHEIKVLEEFEWIRQRPTIYLGPTTKVTKEFYFSDEGKFKDISYIPALQKLFEEIIENSIDEYIRTKGEHANNISITINGDNSITIEDDGRGILAEKHHQFTDLWIPEVIFTKLRSGSNFTDIREGVGVNGLGAVLTVLFSEYFYIETQTKGKKYSQKYENMLSNIHPAKIKEVSSEDTYTSITFLPNFNFFKVKDWNKDMIRKKILDLAISFPKIKFKYNGEKIIFKKYYDLIEKYTDNYVYIEDTSSKLIITSNIDNSPRFHSIVNGANCFDGGPHIDYIYTEIVNNIRPKLEKKFRLELRPIDIKNHIVIFNQLQLKNPIFSSQTKEKIINTIEEIKPILDGILTSPFYSKLLNNEIIVNKIVEEAQLKKKLKDLAEVRDKQKQIEKKKVAKLRDANSSNREECILFLTEGDSALSNSGPVRNPDIHGFLPLRGKVLNVYDLPPSKVLTNEEIQDILNSLSLKISSTDISNLRFGKIAILADRDTDGDCISALLINFFKKYWPSLFEEERILFLNTPLYIAEKKTDKIYIYSKEEHDILLREGKLKGYKISYFKGLGGLERDDWDYFLNRNPQYVIIKNDEKTDESLNISFGNDSDKRKKWMMLI